MVLQESRAARPRPALAVVHYVPGRIRRIVRRFGDFARGKNLIRSGLRYAATGGIKSQSCMFKYSVRPSAGDPDPGPRTAARGRFGR